MILHRKNAHERPCNEFFNAIKALKDFEKVTILLNVELFLLNVNIIIIILIPCHRS